MENHGEITLSNKCMAITCQFHDGMHARVEDSGDSSPPFEVTNVVKQWCVLAPTLFSLSSLPF